jgi:hypothetical protein
VSSNAYLPRIVRYAAVFPCLQTGLCLSGHLWAQVLPLDSINGLRPLGVQLREETYHGRKAVQVVDSRDTDPSWAANHAVAGGGLVILPDVAFHDGTITAGVASKPKAGAFGDACGFVGIAFRVTGKIRVVRGFGDS